MATGTIVLRRGLTGWTADYARTSQRQVYEAVFGQTTVPLPWTVIASAQAVVADVQAREPEATVVVAA